MRNIVHAAILAVVTFFLSFAIVWLELPGSLLLHQFDNSSGPSDSTNIATLLVNFTLYMLFWYLAIRVWKSRRRWKIVGVIVAVVGILITGTVVIPNFLAARTRPQEMAALQTIRSIGTAQSQYHSKFGRYAGSLSDFVLAGNERSTAVDDRPDADRFVNVRADLKRSGICRAGGHGRPLAARIRTRQEVRLGGRVFVWWAAWFNSAWFNSIGKDRSR